MFLFASAYGLARMHSCRLYVDPRIINELRLYFQINLCQTNIEPNTLEKLIQWHNACTFYSDLMKPNVLAVFNYLELKGFWQSYKYFDNYIDEIRGQFTFKPEIKQKIASSNLRPYQTNSSNVTLIGIHIRRGDFLSVRRVSSNDYILESMIYFNKKYLNQTMFIIGSDDKPYCQKHFGNISNVFITPQTFSAGEDLAILSSCKHVVITAGTFGWWAGFLVQAKVIHDVKSHQDPTAIDNNCKTDQYFPNWFSPLNKTI
ncbi:unnamed protein product [Didymodactylos carnosus]|uniref:L-Fucosyltransferase n=1 Tax=Didymodactylos carnosus TaxID=1234261 RepID=A0A814I993_9BILA|nr:unnamed protein product [Didymodactylos carnosus]CAF1020130.1 unnamed protein product [Didymodactylos carnosus]CAF3780878.1 unnamed protein product [Didymodactylos carnosus]CAF3791549.1 unnamed protein product [Didymodactylos carnosus]